MCINSRLLRVCALAGAAFMAGCDGLSLTDDTSDTASTFLGLVVSDFSGTSAISVQNGAVTSESAPASWPQDLLADAPDDAVITVSGTELRVTFTDESVLLNSSTEPIEHRARVTFRFGAAGTNPCASEVFVGPFDVVILDGETAFDTNSLPFTGDVLNIVNAAGFEVCAQADADFDGSVSVGKVKVEFGALKQGEGKVELCHVPPGDDRCRDGSGLGSLGGDRRQGLQHLSYRRHVGYVERPGDGHSRRSDGGLYPLVFRAVCYEPAVVAVVPRAGPEQDR